MNQRILFLFSIFLLYVFKGKGQTNIDTASFNSVMTHLNFGSKNIVVIGEAHTVKGTYETEFFIVRKLAEKGYKTIYLEYGESEAAIFNMYLKTGDSSIINYTLAKWWNAAYYKEFLRSVYRLNKEKGYGLTFRGFDFERTISVGFLFSKWFGNEKLGNVDFKKLSNYLLSLDEFQFEKNILKLKVALDSIKISFAANEAEYKIILKDNFSDFKKIIFNPITNYNTRDYNFTGSMLKIEKEEGLNKSIIVTGNHHALFKKRFIPVLADSLSEKYSVFLFPFLYSNCLNVNGNKKYTTYKKYRKYLSGKEKNPSIQFTKTDQQIIRSKNKNIVTVVVGLYNQ